MAAIKATGKTGGLKMSLDLLEKYLASKYNVKKALVLKNVESNTYRFEFKRVPNQMEGRVTCHAYNRQTMAVLGNCPQ